MKINCKCCSLYLQLFISALTILLSRNIGGLVPSSGQQANSKKAGAQEIQSESLPAAEQERAGEAGGAAGGAEAEEKAAAEAAVLPSP